MNNFVKRSLSGAIFVILVAGSILLGQTTFALFFTIICGWAVFEFHKLTNNQPVIKTNYRLAISSSVLLFACSFIDASGIVHFPVFSLYGLFFILVVISELFLKKQNPVHNWAYFVLGQVFVALPFSMLNYIIFIHGFQPLILLAVFVTIWVNDTGAYLVGITLGKHRLFERISPKKSWEGFFGGAIFALISGYIFSLIIKDINLINWLIFSEIIVIFGTFGDLIESLLKRSLNVKDSGNVIPGHGGLLDRFDSMLLAAPAIYLFLSLLFTN